METLHEDFPLSLSIYDAFSGAYYFIILFRIGRSKRTGIISS